MNTRIFNVQIVTNEELKVLPEKVSLETQIKMLDEMKIQFSGIGPAINHHELANQFLARVTAYRTEQYINILRWYYLETADFSKNCRWEHERIREAEKMAAPLAFELATYSLINVCVHFDFREEDM